VADKVGWPANWWPTLVEGTCGKLTPARAPPALQSAPEPPQPAPSPPSTAPAVLYKGKGWSGRGQPRPQNQRPSGFNRVATARVRVGGVLRPLGVCRITLVVQFCLGPRAKGWSRVSPPSGALVTCVWPELTKDYRA